MEVGSIVRGVESGGSAAALRAQTLGLARQVLAELNGLELGGLSIVGQAPGGESAGAYFVADDAGNHSF